MDEQDARTPKTPTGARERLEAELRAARPTRFAPGFVERVIHRLPESAAPEIAFDSPVFLLDSSLRRQFGRLLPLAAAALIGLVAHNLIVGPVGAGQSALEAALGLEPVTLDVAYAFEPTLYAVSSADGAEQP